MSWFDDIINKFKGHILNNMFIPPQTNESESASFLDFKDDNDYFYLCVIEMGSDITNTAFYTIHNSFDYTKKTRYQIYYGYNPNKKTRVISIKDKVGVFSNLKIESLENQDEIIQEMKKLDPDSVICMTKPGQDIKSLYEKIKDEGYRVYLAEAGRNFNPEDEESVLTLFEKATEDEK